MQNWEISQQEQNLSESDNHVRNPFTQAHHKLVFKSTTDDTQNVTRNTYNQSPYNLQTVPITLDNSEANEDHLLNLCRL